MIVSEWLKGKIIHGGHMGRKIGIPTINLDNPSVMEKYKPGVYSTEVAISDKTYFGSLYYGPRSIMGETQNTLEINLFDFDGNIYDLEVLFRLLDFIRPPLSFKKINEMKKAIIEDNRKIRKLLNQ